MYRILKLRQLWSIHSPDGAAFCSTTPHEDLSTLSDRLFAPWFLCKSVKTDLAFSCRELRIGARMYVCMCVFVCVRMRMCSCGCVCECACACNLCSFRIMFSCIITRHTSLTKSHSFISTYKPTPLPPQLFLCHFHPSSTPLFHSCHLTRNRQFTLSIIWFILWSRSCSYHCTKENFQRNIFNYPLNNKSFHNDWYLPFHLKIIYNQPTVKKPSLNKEDLPNYRPIANLSFISKLTEKIVKKFLLTI